MSEYFTNLRDMAALQIQNFSVVGNRMVQWYREQPFWRRVLIYVVTVTTAMAGLAVLVFHRTIIRILVYVSENLRDSAVGGVVLFTLIFFVGFPPLLGFSALLMLCGMVYGFPGGWPLLAAASILGLFSSFLVFRHFLKNRACDLMSKKEKFRALSEILQEDTSLFLLILIRLCPLPYSLLNGALASIPNISATTYLLASIITSPKMLMHVFVGHAIKNLGEEGRPASAKWLDFASILLACAALFLASYIIYNRMKRRLQSFHGEPDYENMTYNDELALATTFDLNLVDIDDDNFIIDYDNDLLEVPEQALASQSSYGKITL